MTVVSSQGVEYLAEFLAKCSIAAKIPAIRIAGTSVLSLK